MGDHLEKEWEEFQNLIGESSESIDETNLKRSKEFEAEDKHLEPSPKKESIHTSSSISSSKSFDAKKETKVICEEKEREEKKSSRNHHHHHEHSSKSRDSKKESRSHHKDKHDKHSGRSDDRHKGKHSKHRRSHKHRSRSVSSSNSSSTASSSSSSSSASSRSRSPSSRHRKSSHSTKKHSNGERKRSRSSSRTHKKHSSKNRERSRSRDRSSRHKESRERDKDSKYSSSSKSKTDDKKSSSQTTKTNNINQALVTSITNTVLATTTPVTSESAGLNAAELLRQIEIPKELRMNPQEAAKYQMEMLRKKTEELTGVKVPSFYSTTAINPLLYAEQQKKRKLLWSKPKDSEPITTTTAIVGRSIVEGQDEKKAEKFRKLMGIKGNDTPQPNASNSVDEIQKMQKKAFEYMDKEYEYARVTTHLNRGKGLGFATYASSLVLDPNQHNQPQ